MPCDQTVWLDGLRIADTHTHMQCPRCTWVFKGISKRVITMTQKYAWMHDFVRSLWLGCLWSIFSSDSDIFLPHFHFASRHKHIETHAVTNANRHQLEALIYWRSATSFSLPPINLLRNFWQFFSHSLAYPFQKINAIMWLLWQRTKTVREFIE